MEKKLILIGKIKKEHGVKGNVKIISFTTPPDKIKDYIIYNTF